MSRARIRPEIDLVLRERISFESCDEGAASRFARCRQVELRRKDRKVPALHMSWRQTTTLIGLNPDESRILIAGGFDVKISGEDQYVSYMEKRFRHRFLMFANGGWCISSAPNGDNVDSLAACAHTTIPTIKLEHPVEMIVGLLDAFRTLKEDLKLHGILPEFTALQEGKNGIFEILAILEEDARREILAGTPELKQQVIVPPMGRAQLKTTSK